jgi:hypothetical protein
VRANAANPSWELMWGSPGTMIAAQVLYERTGAEHWLEAWSNSADLLWAQWRDDLWLQDLYGRRAHILGPAHGFAGNVFALARGDLLDPARRTELEQRTIATVAKYARRADGLSGGRLRSSNEPVGRSRFEPSGATAHRGSSPRLPHSLRTTSS